MAQPFNLGNSFLGKSTIELVNPDIADSANNRTEISVDADGDLFFQRYKDGAPKGNLKFPVHSYGQSEKKDMHTDANGDVRFVNTWTAPIVGLEEGGGTISATEADPAFYSKELENSCLLSGTGYLYNDANNTQAGSNWGTASSDGSGFVYTMSFWFKSTLSGSAQYLFSNKLGSTDGYSGISFQPEDFISAYSTSGYGNVGKSGVDYKFSDTNAWYHLVYSSEDIGQSSYGLGRMYINGVEVIPGATRISITDNFRSPKIADKSWQYWGAWNGSGGIMLWFQGHFAAIRMIDGQSLDANSFGTFREGVWIPKEYTGEYGNLGYHIDFSDADDLGKDVSGNNNNFVTNNS